jgi:hypothetical protein
MEIVRFVKHQSPSRSTGVTSKPTPDMKMTTRHNQKLHAPQLGLIATDIVLINLGSSDFYQTYLNEGLPTISQVYNDIHDMEGELNSIFLSRKGI